jgi:hypothetical protein
MDNPEKLGTQDTGRRQTKQKPTNITQTKRNKTCALLQTTGGMYTTCI